SLVAALVSAATLTGCGGAASPGAAPAPTQSAYTPPPCPTPAAGKPTSWPKFLPADLPKPANATIQPHGVSTTSDGVHIVKFATSPGSRRSTSARRCG